MNKRIGEENKVKATYAIDPKVKLKIEERATEQDRSYSYTANEVLEKGFEAIEREGK